MFRGILLMFHFEVSPVFWFNGVGTHKIASTPAGLQKRADRL
jgi:hypothetical protein